MNRPSKFWTDETGVTMESPPGGSLNYQVGALSVESPWYLWAIVDGSTREQSWVDWSDWTSEVPQ